ncbi:hypothetical protein ACSS6W_008500 [Trichoderma asperelloides]
MATTSSTAIVCEVRTVTNSDETTPENTSQELASAIIIFTAPNTVGSPTYKVEETGTSSQNSNNTTGQTSNGTPKTGSKAPANGGQETSGGGAESSEPTEQNQAGRFVNSNTGHQYNTTGGIQHNATDTATQFSGAVFSGSVSFHKPQA